MLVKTFPQTLSNLQDSQIRQGYRTSDGINTRVCHGVVTKLYYSVVSPANDWMYEHQEWRNDYCARKWMYVIASRRLQLFS